MSTISDRINHVVSTGSTQTPVESAIDLQSIGRDLIYQRYWVHTQTTAPDTDPLQWTVFDLYAPTCRTSDYADFGWTVLSRHYGKVEVPPGEARLDENFKYLARRVSRRIEEASRDEHLFPEEDYRVDGMMINWERAEELYRKIYGQ